MLKLADYGHNFFVSDVSGHTYEIFLPEEYVEYYNKGDRSALFNCWQTELFVLNQYKERVKQFHENLLSSKVENFFQTYADFDKGNTPSEGFTDYINMVDRYRKQRLRVEAIVCAMSEIDYETNRDRQEQATNSPKPI